MMKAMNLYYDYLMQEEEDNAILAAMEAEEDEEALEAALLEGLESARRNNDWDLYSDLYKDLYGCRPARW